MKPTGKLLLLTIALALTASLVGCGGGGLGGTSSLPEVPVPEVPVPEVPAPEVPAPEAPPRIYTPNYVDTLDGLFHWGLLPIRVFFRLPGNWSDFYPGGLPATAAQSWNQPGLQAFFLVVSGSDQADVTCSFIEYPPADWPTDKLGRTDRYEYPDLQLIASCTVTIAGRHRDGTLLSDQLMQAMIAHELGHALGIDGHSPYYDDLMYPELHGQMVPQERDLNTALTAYQAYFGSRSIPPEPVPAGAMDPSRLIHRTIE